MKTSFELERVHGSLQGTKRAGYIIQGVKRRGKKISNLVKKYNGIIEELIASTSEADRPALPPPLELTSLQALLLDDKFWELERMDGGARWVLEPKLHEGIKALHEHQRAVEEMNMVHDELKRYIHWRSKRLKLVTAFLKQVPTDSPCASIALRAGQESELALSLMHASLLKLMGHTRCRGKLEEIRNSISSMLKMLILDLSTAMVVSTEWRAFVRMLGRGDTEAMMLDLIETDLVDELNSAESLAEKLTTIVEEMDEFCEQDISPSDILMDE